VVRKVECLTGKIMPTCNLNRGAQSERQVHSSHQHGFTLLMVIFMVLVMGIGMGVAMENWRTSAIRAKEQELVLVGRAYRDALRGYFQAYRSYPSTLETLLLDPRSQVPKRYLRKIYADPVTGKLEWGLIVVNDRIVGIHSLSDREPMKSDNFDPSESGFAQKTKYKEWVFTYPFDLKIVNPQSVKYAAAVSDPIQKN
jgi:type II secretory pathway pseudopilin PulG